MILTEEQKANVSVLVNNEVEYQETYQEVYDHILTSLEARQALPDLQKAYREILEDDFGGHLGIEILEESRRHTVWNETFQNQKLVFYRFFKWPGLVLLIALCGLYVYWFEPNLGKITALFSGSVVLLTLSSFIVMGLSNFILKQKKSAQKRSVNNVSIKIMWGTIWRGFIYLWIFRVLCSFVFMLDNAPFFAYHHGMMLALAFIIDAVNLILALYMVAGLAVYRTEFKKRLAA
jgi:hypothetical protein